MIKKSSISIFILAFVLLVIAGDIRKDDPTSPAQRLTNSTMISRDPAMAGQGIYRHIIYCEGDKLYYLRNTNAGASGSWETEVIMDKSGVEYVTQYCLGICAEGIFVYIVMAWRESGSADYEIWFRRSSNNGADWDSWQRLTANIGKSRRPKVACSGQYVYVLWQDDNPGNNEIFFKRSSNYGASFGSLKRLSYSTGESHLPTICAGGAYVYVAWEDNNPGNYEMFFKRSTDYANSFGPVTRLTYNSGNSVYPWLSCDSTGENIYFVWSDNNPGNYEIFFKRNTAYGTSAGWSGPRRMSNTTGNSFHPHVDNFTDGSVLDVIWMDNNPGNYEIISKVSNDYGSTFGSAYRWTYNPGYSGHPKIYSPGWEITWDDDNPGNSEIFFKD